MAGICIPTDFLAQQKLLGLVLKTWYKFCTYLDFVPRNNKFGKQEFLKFVRPLGSPPYPRLLPRCSRPASRLLPAARHPLPVARRWHLPYTARRLHSRHCRHCRQAITLRRTPSAHLACVEMLQVLHSNNRQEWREWWRRGQCKASVSGVQRAAGGEQRAAGGGRGASSRADARKKRITQWYRFRWARDRNDRTETI